ncbi:nicotinamide riboside transporter PnuC [uncultured Xylophilus sp.]|uniref:nicotinamide riboside transporter PnuC n=1 Tax=uncultured Xylophilus sp. TaxID=296832 RepID=UPI0025FE532D|nr:nicotinamide riboside transporter PnuC [uncultured Xylophilus sp.]
MADPLFSTAFTLWGAPVSRAELVACLLGLWMVRMNIRERHWGWPLAAASAALYFFVFWRSGLYADAVLQLFFAAIALWGWAAWLRGRRPDGSALTVARLRPAGRWIALAACALLWPAIGTVLHRYTDSDVPWWDAFPTAASVVGQILLGRKYLENWLVWLGVNLVAMGLFAYKGLWLTTGLYALFAALSVVGWHAWRRRVTAAAGPTAPASAA